MKIEKILKTAKPLPKKKKLVINMMLATTKANSLMADALKAFEISTQQFNVLRILRGQQGKPANLNTIQERMVNKMSNTTRLVDKLLEKKLVDRCVCEENRRKVEIVITGKGLDLLKELDPIVEEVENEISKNLNPEEIEKLNTLLEKIRE
ncbi:MarR family winged helix-turn-helix transcriptional regulator [Autumnicola edwardsiae]|jgi:DNA-binding MarR family transcriptional regulator|uniref:MarR family transcriptional regulator n=1 Tax=Autumnicola edwardsiae TaxID=3075594 RepID=A0ABU3CR05_9FLAO|nr:MarR family transcriptional regulator [Zunongwangia sp. F297]MDT0648779.1 MarR family transcriptional regulator [Zunongwangia sp. F297]